LGVSLGVSLLFPYETPEAPKLHKGCWVFRRACVTFETMFNFLQIPKKYPLGVFGSCGFLGFRVFTCFLTKQPKRTKTPKVFLCVSLLFPDETPKTPKTTQGLLGASEGLCCL
jgi:hypothetical protein